MAGRVTALCCVVDPAAGAYCSPVFGWQLISTKESKAGEIDTKRMAQAQLNVVPNWYLQPLSVVVDCLYTVGY
ncbi:hypothetical protein C7974DRAFT_151839 [Boeremia exigua]|uniref:uncharacterized protein n=1 Tax=Boeremia exigua TaxID=749465 RepID=UPI001E8E5A14|nr:uncharacterized protein C7974DRAFT_151839 [Boeremia exigua]KAH6637985.1 hypothetical protein C7974DRAFT_151839 [Boeremia exigua]